MLRGREEPSSPAAAQAPRSHLTPAPGTRLRSQPRGSQASPMLVFGEDAAFSNFTWLLLDYSGMGQET